MILKLRNLSRFSPTFYLSQYRYLLEKLIKIKRALISVSDKTGIVELAKELYDRNIELVSTGEAHLFCEMLALM